MRIMHKHIESYRVVMGGLLLVFATQIFIEVFPTIYVGAALAAIALGITLSSITAQHFGHSHQHAGDSAIDAIPVAVLLFANILHPAIDGFSAVETFTIGGVVAGTLYVLSIIFHEVLRQTAFVSALAPLHINWKWVTGTAVLGILIGVGAAVGGASFLGRYEIAADIATLFSYSFVIAEFYFIGKDHPVKNTKLLVLLGVLVGVGIAVMMKG
ncbi:MAG: hypothetical protein KBB91_02250 [Candidatus Pacebacteria bacterium]|nr:hypothetical protein [Candidatus Paceibacterota bacterium]